MYIYIYVHAQKWKGFILTSCMNAYLITKCPLEELNELMLKKVKEEIPLKGHP